MEFPLISSIQRVNIYETKARFYIVGSNNTGTTYRVLKVDRTEPKELHIHDDKHIYSHLEIMNLLTTIESGNRTTTKQKQQSTGLTKSVSAYGIVGFVKFLEGYYMVLITKRSKVALIGGHTIYKIEDTVMQYIPNDGVRYTHPDEPRYVKMFQSVDLSSNFYFSYSYDLTHTLQYNMEPVIKPGDMRSTHDKTDNTTGIPDERSDTGPLKDDEEVVYGVKSKPETKYIWNKHLTDIFKEEVHPDWVLHLVYGFIAQCNLYIYGKSVYVALIARRSNEYAGTRFLKRGANSQGSVANKVETEQIVYDTSVTDLHKSKIASFVQMRGSIPVYWSQDISKMVPKPVIQLDQRDPYFQTAGIHFNKCLYRYGSPVLLLNLVKRREKRRHESQLCDEYKECRAYLNQFLPPDKQMVYIGFDMAHYTKKKTNNVLDRLAGISKKCVKQTGFYFHSPNLKEEFWEREEFEGVLGYKTSTGSKQTGVVRTNCVDCLDRTNTAQFAVGKCALAYQLCALGVLSSPDLDFDTDCLRMLEELYEDQGDTVALQYGGSHLVHRIEGYRKIAPWKAHSLDILQTLSRYYSNAFSDLEKQQATNVFLGLFSPKENAPNIWDLPTDFYLHNKDAMGKKYKTRSYTMWCDPNVFDHLPLPYAEACKAVNSVMKKFRKGDERIDLFLEHYKPYERTEFQKVFESMCKAISNFRPKIGRNLTPGSPFERKVTPEAKESRLVAFSRRGSGFLLSYSGRYEANPNISGKDSTSSVTSNMSEEGSSSSASSVEGDIITTSSEDETSYNHISMSDSTCSDEKNIYGFDPARFEEDVGTQDMYQRYVEVGKMENPPEKLLPSQFVLPQGIEIKPLGEYRSDIYCVEEPSVCKRSSALYVQYVNCGMHGASEPSAQNKEIYRNYIRKLYQ
ncbi:polyphosphoinositide phosphatase-like isoform X1 [Ruditapes philippinarum]|uniref:polyphosphoinositide phosphatase-like isoform X1 n=1 Tax=Ruditapes philippinarum TaxID=129788 RepID=UPI00295A8A46|nr:polyphosphoinositide phosphatase-like isoform X1 [Ruditapes philippinarum]